MRMLRAIGWLVLPLLLMACSRSVPPVPESTPPSPSERPAGELPVAKPPQPAPEPERAARFYIFTGPLGFKFPEIMREVAAGETAVMGLEPFDLEIRLEGLTEEAARKGLKVEGATLLAEPVWLPEGGFALQIGPGQPDQVAQVQVALSGKQAASLRIRRAGPGTVTIDQRHGHGWRPVTVLDAYTSPGPSAVRFNFSKPVRKEEVEQALLAAQSVPLRGLMEWADDQTLTWQIAELPPRLDFLLGGAHDSDGLPLPGGIPSLRLGDPVRLVEVDLATQAEEALGTLPPDIISVGLAQTQAAVNLLAWSPGTTKWDWATLPFHFDLAQRVLKSGRLEEAPPRLPADLEDWVISPNGALVAGLRGRGGTTQSYQADLVVMDLRGGRSQSYREVIGRFRGTGQLDLSTRLAWSPDSQRVAALHYAGDPQRADLVVIDPTTGQRTVLQSSLPVRSDGTRLTWSSDGRWLLAGNLLVDLEAGAITPLPGIADKASGAWEPGGSRLLYSQKDWGPILLIDPAQGEERPLGEGMIAGWSAPGKGLVLRWPGSETRYHPPGE